MDSLGRGRRTRREKEEEEDDEEDEEGNGADVATEPGRSADEEADDDERALCSLTSSVAYYLLYG